MIPELKALIVSYQMFYGLETIKEARKYIGYDLRYLAEQEKAIRALTNSQAKVGV